MNDKDIAYNKTVPGTMLSENNVHFPREKMIVIFSNDIIF